MANDILIYFVDVMLKPTKEKDARKKMNYTW